MRLNCPNPEAQLCDVSHAILTLDTHASLAAACGMDKRNDIAAAIYHSGPPQRARTAWAKLLIQAEEFPAIADAVDSHLRTADQVQNMLTLRFSERAEDDEAVRIAGGENA